MPEFIVPKGSIFEENAQLLADLERLADEFNEKSDDGREIAKTLQEAVTALRAAQKQKPQGKTLTLLIDGSQSMAIARKGVDAALKTALDATLEASAAGADVSVLLWGDKQPVPVPVTKDAFDKVMKDGGLDSGTSFIPAVDYMKKAAAEKPRHFVVLADGDLFGRKISLNRTLELLSSSPETRLDIVLIGDKPDTDMAKYAQALRKKYPDRVRLFSNRQQTVANILKEIAAPQQPKLPPLSSFKP